MEFPFRLVFKRFGGLCIGLGVLGAKLGFLVSSFLRFLCN
jgi:hypothetical protein